VPDVTLYAPDEADAPDLVTGCEAHVTLRGASVTLAGIRLVSRPCSRQPTAGWSQTAGMSRDSSASVMITCFATSMP